MVAGAPTGALCAARWVTWPGTAAMAKAPAVAAVTGMWWRSRGRLEGVQRARQLLAAARAMCRDQVVRDARESTLHISHVTIAVLRLSCLQPTPPQPQPTPPQPQPAPPQPQPAPQEPQPTPQEPQPTPRQPKPTPPQPEPPSCQPQPASHQSQPAPQEPEPHCSGPQPQPLPCANQAQPLPLLGCPRRRKLCTLQGTAGLMEAR